MEDRLKHLYEDTFALYSNLHLTVQWAQKQCRDHMNDMEYCTDVAFTMYELNKLINDIGVEIRKTQELAETLVCRTWISQTNDEPIRTEHCTATPDLKLQPAVPKKGTPELAELLDWLGVKENHDAVRIHWPTLCDIVTKRMTEGGSLPKCIDPSNMHNPSAKLRYYKKKGVSE